MQAAAALCASESPSRHPRRDGQRHAVGHRRLTDGGLALQATAHYLPLTPAADTKADDQVTHRPAAERHVASPRPVLISALVYRLRHARQLFTSRHATHCHVTPITRTALFDFAISPLALPPWRYIARYRQDIDVYRKIATDHFHNFYNAISTPHERPILTSSSVVTTTAHARIIDIHTPARKRLPAVA